LDWTIFRKTCKVMTKEIQFNLFEDQRGKLFYDNDFNMADIKRLYIIQPGENKTLRGWQGHQLERKWFFCARGRYEVFVVTVTDFKNPDLEMEPNIFVLDAAQPKLLCIDKRSATAFRPLENDSSLMVFSDMTVEESKKDDYRFNIDTWKIN